MKKILIYLAAIMSLFCGVGVAEVSAAPTVDLYLRGDITNWNARDEFKFEQVGNVYTLQRNFYLAGEFKIGDADWTNDFGSETAMETISIDVQTDLINSAASNKCKTNGVIKVSKIEFDASSCTITIAGTSYDAEGTNGFDYTYGYQPLYDIHTSEIFSNLTNCDAEIYEYVTDFYGKREVTLTDANRFAYFRTSGIIWQYHNTTSGTVIAKSFGDYIQPNGKDRSIIIPSKAGDQVSFIVTDDVSPSGVSVYGIQESFSGFSPSGSVYTANGPIVINTVSEKPKFRAIIITSVSIPDLYLRGDITNWNAREELKFERSGDIYTLQTNFYLAGEFKIGDLDWTNNFGFETDNNVISATATASLVNGAKSKNCLADGVIKVSKIVFDASTSTVSITGTAYDPEGANGFDYTYGFLPLYDIHTSDIFSNLTNCDAEIYEYVTDFYGKREVTLADTCRFAYFCTSGIIWQYHYNTTSGTVIAKSFGDYIQPNGMYRTIIIPSEEGDQISFIVADDVSPSGVSVYGIQESFSGFSSFGSVVYTANGPIIINTVSEKPKFKAIINKTNIGSSLDVLKNIQDGNISKVIQDGQIIIVKNGIRYDIIGRRIK